MRGRESNVFAGCFCLPNLAKAGQVNLDWFSP